MCKGEGLFRVNWLILGKGCQKGSQGQCAGLSYFFLEELGKLGRTFTTSTLLLELSA